MYAALYMNYFLFNMYFFDGATATPQPQSAGLLGTIDQLDAGTPT
jgi:hypothetical protein